MDNNKKPSAPVEEVRWEMEKVPTRQLVEELSGREGVDVYRVKPYQLKTVAVEGPSIAIIVTD